MSQESSEWLNQNTLIGFTDKRGEAWHYRESDQGAEPNHYPGAIPVEDVRRRLFPWEAIEAELTAYTMDDDGDITGWYPDSTRKAIVRSDNGTILGVHGADSYKVHQYQEWLLDNVAMLLDQDLSVGSAGLLKGGAVAWVQVERPENLVLSGGVELRPWILARTSHDSSLKSGYSGGAQNVVCDNTLAAGVLEGKKNGTLYTIKHSAQSEFKVMNARKAVGIMFDMDESFTKDVDSLLDTKVSDVEWQKFLDSLKPVPIEEGRSRTSALNKQAKLNKLWRDDERVAPWAGTAWGVLQAVSTFSQHEVTVRGSMGRPERNMLNTVYGKFQDEDSKTLKRLQAVLA